ncbi:MAG: GTP 3',8-cyclase MoaA [Thermoplasmata archaeon HGW-Thermoplasmata-1]|nr:MAG: GTP 3',8-cyclase MoaA [Thermoplasmata archaeon HGW-Thermoplasmata-1]
MLADSHGREIHNLRIAVTKQCNLSCPYCHREGENDPKGEMRTDEIATIAQVAADLGIIKVKLTGGEPLMRTDLEEIIKRISPLFDEVSMTTNGILLTEERCRSLKEAGLSRVNVSLDTLNRERYLISSGVDSIDEVVAGIGNATAAGLTPVKVNTVVMKGINDGEMDDLVKFVVGKGGILQLIEIETTKDKLESGFYAEHHMDLGDLEKRIAGIAQGMEVRRMHRRRFYKIGQGGVEFVRPMHNSDFCANCNRLRLTSDGRLKPCLLSNDGEVDVMAALRSGASEGDVAELFRRAVSNRVPYWRD